MSPQDRLQYNKTFKAEGLKEKDFKKTPCTSAVLGLFGIGKERFRYSQNVPDMRRIFKRNGWKTTKQALPEGTTWENLNKILGRGYYLVSIKGHVFSIYISDDGKMIVPMDTNPEHSAKFPLVEETFKIVLANR